MTQHDGAYHTLFSHPQLVADLVRHFIPGDWVSHLNFSAMQRVNAKFHAEGLERREGDLIYRIPYQEGTGEVYLYLLLEFQSTPDPWMAVRVAAYVSLLYQQLINEKQLEPPKLLPPVFPLVLYNGDASWNASLDLHSLIALPEHSPLRAFQPQCRYYFLDESRYPQGKPGSITGILFEIENIKNLSDLSDCIARLDREIPADTAKNRSLRRAFLVWLKYVSMPHKGLHLDHNQVEQLSEFRVMLSTRIEQWEQEKIREGMEKGREEGKVKMLLSTLELKFGKLPKAIELKVADADSVSLERWAARLFTATSLDDLMQ